MEARLARTPYLTGSRFTAADLTFAALFSPFVWPAEYAEFSAPEDEVPAGLKAIIDEHRARPAGKHALAMYRLHR